MKEPISHFNKTLGNLRGKSSFIGGMYFIVGESVHTILVASLSFCLTGHRTSFIFQFCSLGSTGTYFCFLWTFLSVTDCFWLPLPCLCHLLGKIIWMAVLPRFLVLVLNLQILDPCLTPPWYLCLSDGHIHLNSATVCLNLILNPLKKKLTAKQTTAKFLLFLWFFSVCSHQMPLFTLSLPSYCFCDLVLFLYSVIVILNTALGLVFTNTALKQWSQLSF